MEHYLQVLAYLGPVSFLVAYMTINTLATQNTGSFLMGFVVTFLEGIIVWMMVGFFWTIMNMRTIYMWVFD